MEKIFTIAYKYWELWRRLTVSRENVEKVVNPPQKPIVKNIRKLGLNDNEFSEKKKTKPRIKLPITFTDKVP